MAWSGEQLHNAIVALTSYAPSPAAEKLFADWSEMWASPLRSFREATPFWWQSTLQGFWERYTQLYNQLPATKRLDRRIPVPEAVQPNDVVRQQWAKLKDTTGAEQAAAWVAEQAANTKAVIEAKLVDSIESLTDTATNRFKAQIAADVEEARRKQRELMDRILLGIGAVTLVGALVLMRRAEDRELSGPGFRKGMGLDEAAAIATAHPTYASLRAACRGRYFPTLKIAHSDDLATRRAKTLLARALKRDGCPVYEG